MSTSAALPLTNTDRHRMLSPTLAGCLWLPSVEFGFHESRGPVVRGPAHNRRAGSGCVHLQGPVQRVPQHRLHGKIMFGGVWSATAL